MSICFQKCIKKQVRLSLRWLRNVLKMKCCLDLIAGLTHCMFTAAEIGIMSKITEGFKIHCSPIIDVGVNLEVWSCFPLSNVYVTHLDNFKTRAEIETTIRQNLRNSKLSVVVLNAKKCIYMLRSIMSSA